MRRFRSGHPSLRWLTLMGALASLLVATSGSLGDRPAFAHGQATARANQQVAVGPLHQLLTPGVPHHAVPVARTTVPAATQGATSARQASGVSIATAFAGIGYDSAPKPDDNAAVGPDDLVQVIDSRLAFFSRTGTLLFSSTLLKWYGLTSGGLFNPRVVYDAQAGHYFLINVRYASGGIGYLDLSASTTAAATGTWCQYHLLVQEGNNQPDFPGLGYDGSALYVSMDMYPIGSNTFQYAKLVILSEAALTACSQTLSSTTFTQLHNPDGSPAQGVQPAQTEDSEPAEYLANASLKSGSNLLTVWTLTNPLTAPALSNATVKLANFYSTPPVASQGGTKTKINTGPVTPGTKALVQVMVRAGMLWTSHPTGVKINGVRAAAVQWCELDPVHLTIAQQQVYALSGSSAYIPAITATSDGSAFLVYNFSDANTFVSVAYASRQATDPANTLPTSGLIQAGQGPFVYSFPGNSQVWGDIASATLDPTDPTKVWISAEYAAANNQWATVIAEIGY